MANFERLGRGRGDATKEREPVAARGAVLKQRGNVIKVPAGQEPSKIQVEAQAKRPQGRSAVPWGREQPGNSLTLP